MISQLLKESMPIYDVFLPVSKKKYKFRPMTVKEEKILLLAQQSRSVKEMGNSLIHILKNCFYELENPETLPIADAEKAFLALRSKSVGEDVNFMLRCPETGEVLNFKINLEDFTIEENKQLTNKLKLTDDMILVMEHPSLKYLSEDENDDEIKKLFKNCFVELQTKENTITKEEISDKDLDEFYDNMTSFQQEKFSKYIQSIPRIKKTLNYTTKDGVDRKIDVFGIDSFFAFASAT
jgi:hypothetical protein